MNSVDLTLDICMGINIPQGENDNGKKSRLEKNKGYLIEFLEGVGVTPEKWDKWYENLPEIAEKSTNGPVKMGISPAEF